MKSFFLVNILIIITIFLKINFISNNNTQNTLKKAKNNYMKKNRTKKHSKERNIFDYYFVKKLNKKNPLKSKKQKFSNKIKSYEISQDFNNWQQINDNLKIFSENQKIQIDASNAETLKEKYNIHSNILEKDVVSEDYRKNDFLIKYNNIINNQGEEKEEVHRQLTSNKVNQKPIESENPLIKKIPRRNNIPNYIPNERERIYNDYSNYHSYSSDDEFDYGHLNNRMGHNFHHQDYNSMGYKSRSTTYKSSGPSFQSNIPQKSKFNEYMSSIYQIMMVFFFFGLVYKLFFGNKQNDKYAMAWYEANKDYFKERYKIFGLVEDEENGSFRKDEDMKDCIMIKENPNNYKLICGNYRYIKYIAVSLQFHKRFDMSLMVASIFVPLKDKIIFQVTFNSVDPCGWVFCIGKKSQCVLIKENYEDLNYFCENYKLNFMDESMCLISEDYDIFVELFNNNKSLIQYYKNVEPFIESIYYSDFINLLTEENNIYFSFDIDLTASYQNRIFLEITHFVNLFVDGLAQIKYTKEFKEKVNNNRALFKEKKINDSRKKEMEEKEKHDFIEKWKIKKKMKGKSGFERRKLEKKLKKYH